MIWNEEVMSANGRSRSARSDSQEGHEGIPRGILCFQGCTEEIDRLRALLVGRPVDTGSTGILFIIPSRLSSAPSYQHQLLSAGVLSALFQGSQLYHTSYVGSMSIFKKMCCVDCGSNC